MLRQITPPELRLQLLSDDPPLLLDVREPDEFAYCRIEGSLHIPMHHVPACLDHLDRTRDIVVICHHGIRSQMVGDFLIRQGFDRVINLAGGIDAWAEHIASDMPRY